MIPSATKLSMSSRKEQIQTRTFEQLRGLGHKFSTKERLPIRIIVAALFEWINSNQTKEDEAKYNDSIAKAQTQEGSAVLKVDQPDPLLPVIRRIIDQVLLENGFDKAA